VNRRILARHAVLSAAIALHAGTASATQYTLHDIDSAGEGLNDPTPFTPGGGNGATTLGDARLRAVDKVLSLALCHFQSDVPIEINVRFDPLTCSATSGLLALSGPISSIRDFPGAPRPNTHYPIALANALAGLDLSPGSSDIILTFNSNIGTAGCLSGASWYYGFDSLPPTNALDFMTSATHELMHGLGFITFTDLSTGAKLLGANDAYMVNLVQTGAAVPSYPDMSDAQRVAANISDPNLKWSGTKVQGVLGGTARMYAPNPLQQGSSVTHFSPAFSPDQLLEPFYTGAHHDPGLAFQLLSDVGWSVQTVCPAAPVAVPATPPWASLLFALLVPIAALLAWSKKYSTAR
jgi:hypothetical protein